MIPLFKHIRLLAVAVVEYFVRIEGFKMTFLHHLEFTVLST